MKLNRFHNSSWGGAQRSGKVVLETAYQRLLVLGGLFSIGFLLLAGRLFFLSTTEVQDKAVVQKNKNFEVSRSNIIDCQGEILATSLITYSLYADTHLILDPKEAAEKLHTVLPQISFEKLFEKLSSGKSFIWIKRNLTPYQYDAINQLGILGLSFQKEEKRVYPYGSLLSHVMGYTNVDHQGIAGIEKKFDTQLRQQKEPLQLTIDIRLQHIVHDELKKAMDEFSALGGCGILIDVRTGHVLSLVSLPDFDPNVPGKSKTENLFNMATLAELEMGSIFKALTMGMALEAGVIDFNSRYDVTQPLKIGRFKIKDYKPKNCWLTVPEVFLYSSNIGTAQIALEVGAKRQKEFFQKLGFLKPSSIELPEVGSPIIPKSWSNATVMTISYGYGLAVSPLQACAGIGSLVNGGYIIEPTLNYNKPLSLPDQRPVIISRKNSKKMRQLMELVVQQGTSKQVAVQGYSIGAKTGSANKIGVHGGYKQDRTTLATSIAVFPVRENPRYVLLMTLDEPKATAKTYGYTTAGWNAAPVVGRTIKRAAPVLGLPPEPLVITKDFSPLMSVAAYED